MIGPGGGDGVGRGVRLGVDVGTVRIGVAASDPDGLIATPVETVPRAAQESDDPAQVPADIARIAALAGERDAAVVYVGLPRHLSGQESAASGAIRTYSVALARAMAPVPVRLVDERLSTVSAHSALHAAGRAGRRHRTVVDQAAAVVILQSALDRERTAGTRSGELVPAGPPPGGQAATGDQGS